MRAANLIHQSRRITSPVRVAPPNQIRNFWVQCECSNCFTKWHVHSLTPRPKVGPAYFWIFLVGANPAQDFVTQFSRHLKPQSTQNDVLHRILKGVSDAAWTQKELETRSIFDIFLCFCHIYMLLLLVSDVTGTYHSRFNLASVDRLLATGIVNVFLLQFAIGDLFFRYACMHKIVSG